MEDEWMDGWTDGWMDEWMDGWMDGWMNAQRINCNELIRYDIQSRKNHIYNIILIIMWTII